MVKPWAISTNFNLRDLLQYVMICSIALFFAAQPVLEVVLDLVEHELCETYEDDEVEEKKEPKFYTPKESTYISAANTAAHSIAETILFAQLSYVREFYLEIPIPPPELV